MYFLVTARDAPNMSQTRKAEFEAHKAHLDSAPASIDINIGGPLLDEDGTDNGSMFVIEAPDLASAKAYVGNDPFQKTGVWQSLQIQGFDWRRGNPA